MKGRLDRKEISGHIKGHYGPVAGNFLLKLDRMCQARRWKFYLLTVIKFNTQIGLPIVSLCVSDDRLSITLGADGDHVWKKLQGKYNVCMHVYWYSLSIVML